MIASRGSLYAMANDDSDPESPVASSLRDESGVVARLPEPFADGVPDWSAKDTGIRPIFEDGEEALAWMKHRRSVEACTAAIHRGPDDPERYVARALVHREAGAHREALEDCSRALNIRPDHAPAYVARAQVHFDGQVFAEAIRDATKALRIDRTRVEALEVRASARAGAGDYAGAVSDYDDAILLLPRQASLFKNRGEMKSRIGDLGGALDDLNVATAMAPDDDDALFKRGLVRVLLDQRSNGKIDWAQVVSRALAISAKQGDR